MFPWDLIAIGAICFGLGGFVVWVFIRPRAPAAENNSKITDDLKHRLGADGRPLHPGNDYERHLYALSLRLQGRSRKEVEKALFDLGLKDVSAPKRAEYVRLVLESQLVGFGNIPSFEEGVLDESANGSK